MYTDKDIKKVCSFCVSDLHLITMLLPYLNRKINEKEKFIVVAEKNLRERVELVLSRLTLKDKDKNKIQCINWDNTILDEEKIKKEFSKESKLNFVINGSKEYIEEVNNNLNRMLENNEISSFIKIINCYDITKLDDDIKDILKTHDIILNTSGEKEISEVFEGYEKQRYA